MGTEQDIFDAALADDDEAVTALPDTDEPDPQPESAAAPEPPQGDQAPAAPDAAPPTDQQPQPQQQPHLVPLRELLDTRERAQAAERERAELARRLEAFERQQREAQQKPPELPDMFADPQGFVQQIQQTFEQRLAAERAQQEQTLTQWSFSQAARQHGQLFNEAWTEFQRQAQAVPALVQAFNELPAFQRGEEVVSWYRQQQAMREIGTDPKAYRAKVEDELLNSPEFIARAIEKARSGTAPSQGSRPSNVTRLPPSLNSQTSAATAHDADNDGSDDAIWAAGTAKRR